MSTLPSKKPDLPAKDDNIFLGRLVLRIKMSLMKRGNEVVGWYGLRARIPGEKVQGEIQLGLTFNKTSNIVGVGDFEMLVVLGRGGFGKVLQVKKKDTGRIYACKVLDKKLLLENDEVEATKMEKEVLRRINHPFIVGMKYSFQTPTKVYLVLDFINGGELFFHLRKERKFSEERCRLYAAELVLALEHLHSMGIIYRDLKPENILLQEDGHVCLTDFGLAKTNVFSGDQTYTFCGTPEYLAPEILRVNQRDGKGIPSPPSPSFLCVPASEYRV